MRNVAVKENDKNKKRTNNQTFHFKSLVNAENFTFPILMMIILLTMPLNQ